MHKWALDLSTIIGISTLLAGVVGLLLGRISPETFAMIASGAVPAICIQQVRPVTELNAGTAVVTPPVVVNTVVPNAKDPVC